MGVNRLLVVVVCGLAMPFVWIGNALEWLCRTLWDCATIHRRTVATGELLHYLRGRQILGDARVTALIRELQSQLEDFVPPADLDGDAEPDHHVALEPPPASQRVSTDEMDRLVPPHRGGPSETDILLGRIAVRPGDLDEAMKTKLRAIVAGGVSVSPAVARAIGLEDNRAGEAPNP